MLTQERLKELLDYDPETGVFTWRVTRGRARSGRVAGCIQLKTGGKRYISITVDRFCCLAHRLAVYYVTGVFPLNETDHHDGNGLNNSYTNLRCVPHQENCKNMRRSKANTSGATGVSWHRTAKKWRVRVRVNGQDIHLGFFHNREEAISTRKAAELEHNYHPNHGSDRPL